MYDYKTLLEINRWLESNPGVFVAREAAMCWASAHAASGIDCDPKTFKTQCRRAGVDVRKHPGGFLLDCSDGRDLVTLGVEP